MVYLQMALIRDRQHGATAMRRVLRIIFFCVFFAGGLSSCTTAPVREKELPIEPERVQPAEPEKHAPEPRELIAKAANVAEFTKLIYPEETSELKTPADKIKITVKPQSPESARKEVRSYYAAYCETSKGQLSTDLPDYRIPENLPSHIKPPYSQRFKKKYDLPPSVLWCQDKEDVFFGVEMKDSTDGVDGPGLNVTIYTEGFVEKNRVRTSQKDMIAKIEKEIEKAKSKLDNPAFRDKVPANVLEEHEARLKEWQAKFDKTKAAIEALEN